MATRSTLGISALGALAACAAGASEGSFGGGTSVESADPPATGTATVCGDEDSFETGAESPERLGTCTALREVIRGHNDANDTRRINIVFAGVGFSAYQDFKRLAERATGCSSGDNGVLTLQPLRNHADLFNFWMSPRVEYVSSYEPGASDIVYKARDICRLPNTVPFGLIDWEFRSHADQSPYHWIDIHNIDVRSLRIAQDQYRHMSVEDCQSIVDDGCRDSDLCNSMGRVYEDQSGRTTDSDWHLCKIVADRYSSFGAVSISTRTGSYYVIAHELGHALFGLFDEVDEGARVPEEVLMDILEHPSNCFAAVSVDECEEHYASLGIGDASCPPGCAGVISGRGLTVFRPYDTTIMRSSWNGDFGSYNISRATKILEITSGLVGLDGANRAPRARAK